MVLCKGPVLGINLKVRCNFVTFCDKQKTHGIHMNKRHYFEKSKKKILRFFLLKFHLFFSFLMLFFFCTRKGSFPFSILSLSAAWANRTDCGIRTLRCSVEMGAIKFELMTYMTFRFGELLNKTASAESGNVFIRFDDRALWMRERFSVCVLFDFTFYLVFPHSIHRAPKWQQSSLLCNSIFTSMLTEHSQ